MSESSVAEYYDNAKVFITGGTGFLGRVLVEKLLRVCSVDRIYLLIRIKKGKDPQARMKELFDVPLFNKIRETNPDFMKKITCIQGDVSEERFNMSDSDYELLTNEVTHVIHSAATVRFNEHLKSAIKINVFGTQEIIKLCNKCIRLKIFVHVSTAYSKCVKEGIDEVFYEPPMSAEKAMCLTKILSDEKLELITPELIKPWPNTYCFSKSIAENLVRENMHSIPTVLFRPSVVMGSLKEPIEGWIDNIYGPTGLILAAGVGLLRTVFVDGNAPANIVPVDLTVNALIAAAWDVGSNYGNSTKDSLTASKEIVRKEPKIYNFIADKNNSVNWSQFIRMNLDIGKAYPTEKSIWYYSVTVTNCKIWYLFLMLFLHHIPAVLLDTGLVLLGKKPQARKGYQKLHALLKLIRAFATEDWNFKDQNTRKLWSRLSPKDKELFYFDMTLINWHNYFVGVIKGVRRYILNENDATLPAARKKIFFLYIGHKVLQFCTIAFCLWILSKLLFVFGSLKTQFTDTILIGSGSLRNST